MSTLADPTFLFSEFGRKLGLPDLKLDDNNAIRLTFDDIVIDAQYDPDKRHLILLSVIGNLPAAVDTERYANLLEVNLAGLLVGTGAIGLDRQENRLIYADHLSFEGLEQAAFEEFFRQSVNVAEAWRNLISSREFTADARPDAVSAGEQLASLRV
ncbi:hypothetical protein FHS82_001528 [Pseudochelatococcus lubricantis]|uniref:Uncharacterized protein n=1 Tax=Pseudochelatococcus lubricantis TaxID=1538102 RepID=A0ABX0UXM0_9HYPH|nr:type III secretion system chaperone [Pseudochelatococcus lubricantis]NIJ57692.1 hypothetical protein [Pseudochelatococcus lubricantis]